MEHYYWKGFTSFLDSPPIGLSPIEKLGKKTFILQFKVTESEFDPGEDDITDDADQKHKGKHKVTNLKYISK